MGKARQRTMPHSTSRARGGIQNIQPNRIRCSTTQESKVVHQKRYCDKSVCVNACSNICKHQLGLLCQGSRAQYLTINANSFFKEMGLLAPKAISFNPVIT